MAIVIKDASGNVLPQNPEDLNDYNIRSEKYKIPSTVDESHTHLKKQIEDFAHTHPISEVEGLLVNFVNRKDLSSEVQRTSYRRSVIALCEVTNTIINLSSYSRGALTFKRNNGLSGAPILSVLVGIEKRYNTSSPQGHILNIGGDANIAPRLCTFTYNGVKYGGLEFYYNAAQHDVVVFEGESNFNIFGLDYFNTQTSTALNTEVNSSLAYDVFYMGRPYYNTNEMWHAGNFNPSEYFKKSGDTLTDVLRVQNYGTHQAIVQASSAVGDYLFGGTTTIGGAISAYLRVASDKLRYHYGASVADIWHTGNLNPANYLALSGGTMTGDLITKKLIVSGSPDSAHAPVLGSIGSAGLYLTNANPNYGLMFGVNSQGNTWIQAQRSDGNTATYGILLNPAGGNVTINNNTVWHAGNFNPSNYSQTNHTHATLTNGVGIVGYPYDGSTARSWYVGAGTGISVGSVSVSLTDIAAGSSTVGTVRYNGTTKSSARFYGGTSTPTNSTSLHYDGTFLAFGLRYGSGGSSSYSDIRMKKDVGSLNYAEQLILKLKPKQFRFKDEFEPPEEVVPSKAKAEIPTSRTSNRQQLHYGLIAQDVEKIVDELGLNRPAFLKKPDQENEYYSINYVELIAPMIDVIQKQQNRIDEIERLLERLA